MRARLPRGLYRLALVGALTTWFPCMPMGLCAPAGPEPGLHHCCPSRSGLKIAPAPVDCSLQTRSPMTAAVASASLSEPAPAAAPPLPAVIAAAPAADRTAAFSPLAVVLRI
jgi:hypothetical protein